MVSRSTDFRPIHPAPGSLPPSVRRRVDVGVRFPVYVASSQSRLGSAECRGSWADEVRRRPAEEPVHAAPRAAQYEAMTELPDPVDQDRDEVLTIGGWPWRPGTRQGVITIIAAIAIAAGVLTGLLVTRQHTAASHPAPPGSVARSICPRTCSSTGCRPSPLACCFGPTPPRRAMAAPAHRPRSTTRPAGLER